MHLSKITDYDKPNLSANNPAAGAVDMWVTGQFQLSTYPSAHKYYGDILGFSRVKREPSQMQGDNQALAYVTSRNRLVQTFVA